jgi:hypothetical protein
MKNTTFAIILVMIMSSCLPVTKFRREALVPSPQPPPYRGETLGRGHMEFQAQVAGSHVYEEEYPLVDYDSLYDDALWVPEFMINASGMFGIASIFDLGFLLTYAHGSWANPSALGTPPMPDDGKHLFAIGPQVGLGGKFLDGKLFFGGYASFQYVRIPWSEWEADNVDPYSTCYHLNDEGADNDLYYRFGVYFGGRPAPWVALNAGIVVHASWINIGFSNEDYDGSTLDQKSPLLMPLLGARFDIKPVFFETFVTFPISTVREISYFPLGWSAAIGVRI